MKRKSSPQVKCDICGKVVEARGLVSHVRLLHKLKLTESTKVIPEGTTQVTTQVITQVKPKLIKKVKPAKDEPCEEVTQVVTQVKKPTQVVTQVTTQVVTERTTQVVEKQKTYTPYPTNGNFLAELDWHSKNNSASNTYRHPEHSLNSAALKLGSQLAAIEERRKKDIGSNTNDTAPV